MSVDRTIEDLGESVTSVLLKLVEKGFLKKTSSVRIATPGANTERIKYFINEKSREALSSKTNPDKLDQARTKIQKRLTCSCAESENILLALL